VNTIAALLELKRIIYTPTTTLGVLRLNGQFQCFTCEDVVRALTDAKVPGATAIPVGRYRVDMRTESPRFSKLAGRPVIMPRLIDVPNFSGVLIHSGNDHRDTEGCVLVGAKLRHDEVGRPDGVLDSRHAYAALFDRLLDFDARGEIFIDVRIA
jgi:hypothetical protein